MTVKTADAVSSDIINTLHTTCPGLSLQVGTVERKIVDAVAEAISEAYIDSYLLGSLLDVDTKGGLELENFVGIFGFGRMQGHQAAGTVTMTLSVASPVDFPVPLGQQFYTKTNTPGTSTPLYFASTQATVLTAGSLTIDVPAQCTSPGVVGNVAPDTITYLGVATGSSSVTNLTAFTGGVDAESDADLRQRFKDTLLRNSAGTSDFYEAICLQNTSVSKVVVFGPTRLETLQVVAPSVSTPIGSNVNDKFAWPQSESVFLNMGQSTEIAYTPGSDYVFTGGTSPTLTRISTGMINQGDILDVQYEYCPQSSRNDPINGITNKVDIFVNGVSPYQVVERTVVGTRTLSSTSTDMLYTGNLEHWGTSGTPQAGHRFTRLANVPLASFPATIVVGNVVYQQGTHYHVCIGTTLLRGSQFEVAGIEWITANPASTTELTLTFNYNRTPKILQAIMRNAKQIGTDVMVHQADYRFIQPCLTVQYDKSYAVEVTNNGIATRLQQYFDGLPYGTPIQVTNMLLAVMQVLGVVDVDLTTQAQSPTAYGIRLYENSGDPLPIGSPYTDDFQLADNQLCQFTTAITLRTPTVLAP